MQNTTADAAASTAYRERLSPSLWALVAAALCGPMAALVFTPLNSTLALFIGAAVSVAIVALLVLGSPVVAVRDGVLHAGKAHIDGAFLGDVRIDRGDDARERRGPALDSRAWHMIRGGIDGLVTVRITDPDDPTPVWVMSSRTPERLAAAIRRAQATPRTPRR